MRLRNFTVPVRHHFFESLASINYFGAFYKRITPMNRLLLLVLFILPMSLSAQDLVEFENGQVADAYDINANFQALKDSIDDVNSIERNFYAEVNCEEDPYALINAYHDNIKYSKLFIGIKGDCFGDISYTADYGTYTQEFSQSIIIYGITDADAGIIPRPKVSECGDSSGPTGGVAGLVASFQGSLTLRNLDLRLGECDSFGVLYSRGAGGTVENVSITGHPATSNQKLLIVRHNSIIYTGSVSITGYGDDTVGIEVFNGGVIYSYGSPAVSVTGTALQMFAGGGFFSYGANISLSGRTAMLVSSSRYSNLPYAQTSITSVDGDVLITNESVFSTTNLNFASESEQSNRIERSYLQVTNDISSVAEQKFQCHGNSTVDLGADYTTPYAEGTGCLNSLQWTELIENYCDVNSAC
jgi:hypothetical protein